MARHRPRPTARGLAQMVRRGVPQTTMTQAQPAQAAAPPAVDPYDFSGDPVLQRIQALGQQRVAQATASALAARKQLAIDTGDLSLAPDEETRQAAMNNPFSVAALFAKKAHDAPQGLTADQSKANLGYSSAGAVQQSNLATSLLGEQQGNQRTARDRAQAIQDALMGVEQTAQNDLTGGQEDAAARLQARLGDLPVGPKKQKVAKALGPRRPAARPGRIPRLPRHQPA